MAVAERPQAQTENGAREQIAVTNPVTLETIGHIPVMTGEEVEAAARRARAAQPAWEARGVAERARLLQAWGDLLWANQETAIEKIRAETGKNYLGAWAEVTVIDNVVAYYRYRAAGILNPKTRRTILPGRQTGRVYYKPHGVCGFITPWNYPLNNGFIDLIPALVAGNTVLLKPSEITPFTAQYAVELMHQAGIPPDVIQVVTGDGRTGAALVEVVDYISFTGSTATGKKIALRAAERLIPCSLELGGNTPVIILKDADLDRAATGTLAGTIENSGQVCVSVGRVYAEDAIYDRYVERLRNYAGQVVQSPGDGVDVHMGSMTNEREIERVERHVADAVAKGAEVVHGGKRRPDLGPRFYEPTILANVDPTMEVMREETFGPVVPVMRVKNADEAIRLANDSEYGLSSAIFTGDLKQGERLAGRIEAGDVHVNTTQWIFGTPSLPMGGVKSSGIGRRNGPEGILRFVKPQSVLKDNGLLTQPFLGRVTEFERKLYSLQRAVRRWLPLLRL